MLPDPMTVTVGSNPAKTLPRTRVTPEGATYVSDDGDLSVTFQHSYGKRQRHLARIEFRKKAADPLTSGLNQIYSGRVHIVTDAPLVGFTAAELNDFALALTSMLGSGTPEIALRHLQGES